MAASKTPQRAHMRSIFLARGFRTLAAAGDFAFLPFFGAASLGAAGSGAAVSFSFAWSASSRHARRFKSRPAMTACFRVWVQGPHAPSGLGCAAVQGEIFAYTYPRE